MHAAPLISCSVLSTGGARRSVSLGGHGAASPAVPNRTAVVADVGTKLMKFKSVTHRGLSNSKAKRTNVNNVVAQRHHHEW